MITNIIFDMDGTLSDTAKATLASIESLTEKHNLPKVHIDSIKRAMGYSGYEYFSRIFPGMDPVPMLEIGAEIDELEDKMIAFIGKGILFPGVAEMLHNLVEHGIIIHVASCGSQEHVETTLEAGEIYDYFTKVGHGEPVKIDMVSSIIGDGNKEEWLMVGDFFKDAEAAHENGIKVVGAKYGYLADSDHELFDYVIEKPEDLLKLISSL